MKLNVLQVGETILRAQARPLSREEILESSIQALIEQMRGTLRETLGVGLAAPQVGRSVQLAVIEDQRMNPWGLPPDRFAKLEWSNVPFQVIINPQITVHQGERVEFFEGCLSVAGYRAIVPRARTVQVHCLDHAGEPRTIHAEGWYARILQHEIDHLNGTLYVDRMNPRTFMTHELFTRYWKDLPIEDVIAAFA